jgi:isocitrate/isopropylmalate dehydrogenase
MSFGLFHYCELTSCGLSASIGETYRNVKRVINFAYYIAKTEKQKLVDQINESKYISVICGGFTDTARNVHIYL